MSLEYEQLKLIDVDQFRGKMYSGHCPLCHWGDRFTIEESYRPPEGIDPRTLRVKCAKCDGFYFVVRSGK